MQFMGKSWTESTTDLSTEHSAFSPTVLLLNSECLASGGAEIGPFLVLSDRAGINSTDRKD